MIACSPSAEQRPAEPVAPPASAKLPELRIATARLGLDAAYSVDSLETETSLLVVGVAKRPRPSPPPFVLARFGPELQRLPSPFAADKWPIAEDYETAIERLPKVGGLVKLTVRSETGEDFRTRRELIALYHPEDMHLVWAGEGNLVQIEMDRCTRAVMTLLSIEEGALVITHKGYAEWEALDEGNSQTPDFELLRKGCKAPEGGRQRVRLRE